ncbi:unnamed protein product, partial [Discosporangium mesarthrocarpum]
MKLIRAGPKGTTELKNGASMSVVDGAIALTLNVWAVEEDMFRICFRKGETFNLDRSWMVAPGLSAEECAPEGRERMDLSGFSCPEVRVSVANASSIGSGGAAMGDVVTVESSRLRVVISGGPLHLEWFWREGDGEWLPLASDLPTGAYYFSRGGGGG